MQTLGSPWRRLVWIGAAQVLCTGLVFAQSKTYTTDADFDEGSLVNVNHDAPFNDQLQLNFETKPFPFVNIAVSGRGTAVRIDVNTGEVLGEYSTNPDSGASTFPNPSRTTVDKYGNVWVANRDENTTFEGVQHGSIMRYGLVVGGTRVDADGTPNPLGQYLQPPFEYSTAVDRDGDGLIKTSNGLGNILPWSNAGGVDTYGGVTTAEDECIMNYVLTPGTGTRTLAIDAENDVWVGCFGGVNPGTHVEVDVNDLVATVDPTTQFNLACGGYGGFIDGNGILWSAGRHTGLLRYDTVAHSGVNLGTAMGDYGLGLDPNTGNVWHSTLYGPAVYQIDPFGLLLQSVPQLLNAQGVAVDSNGHVWVAELFGDEVMHYAPDPLVPSAYILVGHVGGFAGTTGVAVDANGKVWASEQASDATRGAARIDPALGAIGAGGYPIGAIDMTVGLGAGGTPYNYSDMTGFVLLSAVQEGTWRVVYDTGKLGATDPLVTWTSDEPVGTELLVEARAADLEVNLASETFVTVVNGVPPVLTGKFVELRATFSREPGAAYADLTPVLFDLTIQTNTAPVALCRNLRLVADENCQADGDVNDGSYDPDGDPITVMAVPAGPYPLGATQVTLYVTDSGGLFDTCTALVQVLDKTPPTVVMGPMKVMWPPDHQYDTFALSDFIVEIHDNCGEVLGVCGHAEIIWIGSDELEDAPGVVDGRTMNDCVILGPQDFALRRERCMDGNGRVYTICFLVWDDAGNSVQETCYVCVPTSMECGERPVDDTPTEGYTVYAGAP